MKAKHDNQDKTIFEFKTRNDKLDRENTDLKNQVDNLKNKMIQSTGSKNMGYSGLIQANNKYSTNEKPRMTSPMKRSGMQESVVLGGGGKNRETIESHFRSTSLTKNKSGGKNHEFGKSRKEEISFYGEDSPAKIQDGELL